LSKSYALFAIPENRTLMSRRFRPLKPLDKNKHNRKNRDAVLLKPLQTAQESAETALYDFLYIDRERISSLYAQLFPQGTLTSVKTTAQHGFADDQSLGSDLKVIKGETKATDTGSEGIEHTFDTSWAIPIEVLARLSATRLVRSSLSRISLGTIAQLDSFLRIIELRRRKGDVGTDHDIGRRAGQARTTGNRRPAKEHPTYDACAVFDE